jgi:hypothetical protein
VEIPLMARMAKLPAVPKLTGSAEDPLPGLVPLSSAVLVFAPSGELPESLAVFVSFDEQAAPSETNKRAAPPLQRAVVVLVMVNWFKGWTFSKATSGVASCVRFVTTSGCATRLRIACAALAVPPTTPSAHGRPSAVQAVKGALSVVVSSVGRQK